MGAKDVEEAAVLRDKGIMALKTLAMHYNVYLPTMSKVMKKMGVFYGHRRRTQGSQEFL